MNQPAKKYLIRSQYFYYDDYDVTDVCICDTKEKAETRAQIFQNQIDLFKSIKGYVLYLDRNNDKVFINEMEEENIVDCNHDTIRVFVTSSEFESLKDELTEYGYYFEKINYFNFMTLHNNKDSIIKKYCNHESANLSIQEIDYLE